MNKKQALALLRRKRGRGRPSKALAKKLAQARKLVKLSPKGKRRLKKMGKTVAKKLVGAKRHRGRPSLAMSAKLRKARKLLQNPSPSCDYCGKALKKGICMRCLEEMQH